MSSRLGDWRGHPAAFRSNGSPRERPLVPVGDMVMSVFTRWIQARGLEAGYRGATCAQGMRVYMLHSR